MNIDMNFVAQLFQVCIIPLLGVLTKFLIDFLLVKAEEAKAQTDSTIARKYIDMIYATVSDCVIATNQTYVNSLKASGSFDEKAQKEAFDKTLAAVLAILGDDAKDYIQQASGDVEVYLTQLIEAEVNKNRQA